MKQLGEWKQKKDLDFYFSIFPSKYRSFQPWNPRRSRGSRVFAVEELFRESPRGVKKCNLHAKPKANMNKNWTEIARKTENEKTHFFRLGFKSFSLVVLSPLASSLTLYQHRRSSEQKLESSGAIVDNVIKVKICPGETRPHLAQRVKCWDDATIAFSQPGFQAAS